MITLLTGKTGSGKSYQAVTDILKALEEGRNVFTNIHINIDFPNYNYIDELGVRDFVKYIENTFDEVNNLDDKKAEINLSKYYNSDFFIDEAHLVGFKKNSDGITNWLTIHRHFDQNIIIITQVPTNVHRSYMDLFHKHINMIPPNKRLSKNTMGYKEYDSYKGDRLSTKFYKPNTDIFELYNSGNVELGFNQDVIKLGLVFVGLLGLGFTMYSFSNSFMSKFDDNKTIVSVPGENSILKAERDLKNLSAKIEDINQTVLTENVICDTDTGCNYLGNNMPFKKFLFYVLPNHKYKEKIVMTSSIRKDWKMILYTLTI